MSGRVCERHERWCPDGVCPYCEQDQAVVAMPWKQYAVPVIVEMPQQPWPASLAHVPPAVRFVDAATGKPKPLVGKHFPAVDRDACALCGKSGLQIMADPTTDCA